MADNFKFAEHADKYPPIIPRAKVQEYFPWLSQKRLANLDNCGEGPANAFKNGRAILYPTESFLNWLDERTRPQKSKQSQVETDRGHGEKKAISPSTRRRGRKTKKQEILEQRGI